MPETAFHTTFSTSHFWLSRAKNGSESGFRSAVSYRFGFNGQEMDNEISGQTGTHTTAMFWEYDSRLGRRWNLDPKPQVNSSDYSCFANNPIWFSDIFGNVIDSGRTEGKNFVVIPTKESRVEDRKDHFLGIALFSAYYWSYHKAQRLERKGWTVIESDDEKDAVNQIVNKLVSNEYVQNLVIDYHRSTGSFSDYAYSDGTVKDAFGVLASHYAGKSTNVYLGMCWAGGNSKAFGGYEDLTRNTSQWLDGATTYGHQAEGNSFSFWSSGNFSGFSSFRRFNRTVRKVNTVSYYEPLIGQVRTVEVRGVVTISNSSIHFKNNVLLWSYSASSKYEDDSQISLPLPFKPL